MELALALVLEWRNVIRTFYIHHAVVGVSCMNAWEESVNGREDITKQEKEDK